MFSVNLRAWNGLYVCANNGGGDGLVANRAEAREWETFALLDQNGAKLNDGDPISLQTFDGHFVCAEGGGGKELVANRTQACEWETFTIQNMSRAGGEILSGDRVSLRTFTGNYVCAEGGGGREVSANRAAAHEWESFKIEFVPQQPLRYDTGDVVVGAGKYMHTNVALQSDGLMITITRTETHVIAAGFHGGCMVCICDAAGNVIANGPLRIYGVDGQWTGLAWTRTDREEDHFDPTVYEKAHHFQVFQAICPRSQLMRDIAMMAEAAKTIAGAFSDFKGAIGS